LRCNPPPVLLVDEFTANIAIGAAGYGASPAIAERLWAASEIVQALALCIHVGLRRPETDDQKNDYFRPTMNLPEPAMQLASGLAEGVFNAATSCLLDWGGFQCDWRKSPESRHVEPSRSAALRRMIRETQLSRDRFTSLLFKSSHPNFDH